MKKPLLFLVAIVLIVGYGCKKSDGPTGPAGPAGPAGATGASSSPIITVDTFVVTPSQWTMTSTNYYQLVHTNTAITQAVVDTGTIQVFAKDAAYPDWYAFPDVVAGSGQAGLRFSFNLNKLTLYGDNFTSGPPGTMTIKEIIMR